MRTELRQNQRCAVQYNSMAQRFIQCKAENNRYKPIVRAEKKPVGYIAENQFMSYDNAYCRNSVPDNISIQSIYTV